MAYKSLRDFIDQLEAEMREGKVDMDAIRPSLRGFDAVASGFLSLTNQIIALRAEQGRNPKLKTVKGPVFPTEIVEERLRKFASMQRMSAIERSQAKWRSKNRPEMTSA